MHNEWGLGHPLGSWLDLQISAAHTAAIAPKWQRGQVKMEGVGLGTELCIVR